MRTTLDIDLQSYRLAKAIAAQSGTTLGKVVGEAIRRQYAPEGQSSQELQRSKAGFLTVTIGYPITDIDVAESRDE